MERQVGPRQSMSSECLGQGKGRTNLRNPQQTYVAEAGELHVGLSLGGVRS
jgi:hypothetical protein